MTKYFSHISARLLFAIITLSIFGCKKQEATIVPTLASKESIYSANLNLAEHGDTNAQLILAQMFANGDGVKQDAGSAYKWFLKAAEGENVNGMVEVAKCLLDGNGTEKNLEKYRFWIEKAAKKGNPNAEYEYTKRFGIVNPFNEGDIYIFDEDNEADTLKEWMTWLEKSSTHGVVAAQYDLGIIRLRGVKKSGSKKDTEEFLLSPATAEGLALLKGAAEKKYWKAQRALAILYQDGFLDIAPSPILSAEWWRLLSETVDSQSQFELGDLYFPASLFADVHPPGFKDDLFKWNGHNLSSSEAKKTGLQWYLKAAAQSNVDAAYRLSEIYKNGTGGYKDIEESTKYLKQAAEKDYPNANLDLGLAYIGGKGVIKDYSRAFDLILKAANQRRVTYVAAKAKNIIGYMTEKGYATEQDAVLAYVWYNLAAASGDEEAKTNLTRLEKTLKYEDIKEAQSISGSWNTNVVVARLQKEKSNDAASNQENTTASSSNQAGGKLLKLASTGTGFFISNAGQILTNNHIVQNCKEIRLPATNKIAKLIVADDVNDMAVVKIGESVKYTATIYEPDDLKQGEDIIVFGYPLDGFLPASGNIALGVVSALAGIGNNSSSIQISAPVQLGNSGGPVLNRKGLVVGLVLAKANAIALAKITGDIPQNLNFAVSGRTVKSFLDGNRIEYSKGRGFFSFFKSTVDVADEAREYSIKLECWR